MMNTNAIKSFTVKFHDDTKPQMRAQADFEAVKLIFLADTSIENTEIMLKHKALCSEHLLRN